MADVTASPSADRVAASSAAPATASRPLGRAISDRLRFSEQTEPFQLRARAPHVHGYAWRRPAPSAAVVLVHGLQSHAQWFAEAADILHQQNLAVYAVDRRGSGSSPEVSGHIGQWHEWADEVADVAESARRETGAPVHLVGHCFGANVALCTAMARPDLVASVVMLTPGFYVLPDYSLAEKVRILFNGLGAGEARFRVPQDDDLFTRDPEVLAWIRADRLGARTLTAHTLLEIRRMLGSLRGRARELQLPLLVFEAARDRISDNRKNGRFIDEAFGARCKKITYDAEHFLLAEACRDQVLGALVEWVRATPR